MNKYRAIFTALAVVSAVSTVPPAIAGQGRGQGPAKKAEKAEKAEKHDQHDQKANKKDDKGADGVFVDRDGHIYVIREYAKRGSLPPGLEKRQALPPGLREQLRKNGELPPGLQKRLVPVPEALEARMPAIPDHHRRYFVGEDLIVLDTRNDHIAAIVRDVWR